MASLPAFRPAGLLIGLRRRFRTSEAALILLALGIGLSAGLLTLVQSSIAHFMQSLFYGVSGDGAVPRSTWSRPTRCMAASFLCATA